MASRAPSVRVSEIWPAEVPPLRELTAPANLWIPLPGRINPLPPGTHVPAGDAINGEPVSSGHIPIAPIAGVLADVREVSLTDGRKVRAVELIADKTEAANIELPALDPPDFDDAPDAWIDFLRKSGINASRHYSPDLIAQLESLAAHPVVDTVICPILDTDAALRLSGVLAARSAHDLTAGIEVLSQLVKARKVIVAIEEDADSPWMKSLRMEAKTSELRVVELANDYPQADPTLILYTLINRRLRPGHLPTEQGVILIDAAAALAVGDAQRGHRMRRVPMAIHDHFTQTSHFISVPIGATLDYVLGECGIADEQLILRGGDLLRDKRITADSIVGPGEITIHAAHMELPSNPDPCIRSGWCIDICPTRVQPAMILEAAQHSSEKMAKSAGIEACIECGLCSHVCPSRLPLLEAIRMMRGPAT